MVSYELVLLFVNFGVLHFLSQIPSIILLQGLKLCFNDVKTTFQAHEYVRCYIFGNVALYCQDIFSKFYTQKNM